MEAITRINKEKSMNISQHIQMMICLGFLTVGLMFWSTLVHAADRNITDDDINRAVEGQLIVETVLPYDQLDVSTYKGIVTLNGEVDNILIRERVQRVAASIKGVRGIVNRIIVKKNTMSDTNIQKAVESAWLRDPVADSYELSAKVNNGVVTVNGTVQSWAEQQISLNVAKGVKGVREIEDNITIKPGSARPENEMKAEISSRLQYDVLVDDLLIKVAVDGTKAVLSGKVGSLTEKNRAILDAWITGITEVEAESLDVVWGARYEMLRDNTALYKNDIQIRSAVQDALLVDPRVYAFNPRLTIQNGVVYLNGVVDNFRAKKAAESDTRNIIGVKRVKNLLKVRPTDQTPDDVLKKWVKNALEVNPVVDEAEVDVRVDGGKVYLYGKVDDRYEKYHAGRVVETVDGVIRVENFLTYPDRVVLKSDSELVGDIEDKLFWSAYVDSDQVHVTASNGNVTLSGQVSSSMEQGTAEDNAYEAGAKYVINKLTIMSDRFHHRKPEI